MTSNIVYERKLLNNSDHYLYSETYIEYLIIKFMHNKEETNVDDIYKYLGTKIDEPLLNKSSLKKYLNEYYISFKNSRFSAKQEYQKNYDIVNDFRKKLDFSVFSTEQSIYKKISAELFADLVSFENLVQSMLMLYYKNNDNKDKDYFCSKYFYILNNEKEIRTKIDNKLELINKFYDKLGLENIIEDKVILNILLLNNIVQIEQFKKLSSDKIVGIFAIEPKIILDILETISGKNDFSSQANYFYEDFSEKDLVIFSKRYNYEFTDRNYTLDEIGQEFGVTRERIRQIEKKAINKLLKKKDDIRNIIICLYEELSSPEKPYFSMEELKKHLNNSQFLKIVLFFMQSSKTNIKYDEEYGVIYNSKIINVSQIINERINEFGEIVNLDSLENLSEFDYRIIDKEYRTIKGILVSKKLNHRDIFMKSISDIFTNGYRIGNIDDYNLLKNTIVDNYGEIDDFPSQHSLQAMLERSDFIQCDRGTYIPLQLAPHINDELFDEIIQFVIDSKPVVYYRSIYEVFSDKLNDIGINNHYYLKGCIDKILPKEFKNQRDYISVVGYKGTPGDHFISAMREFGGEFSLDEIKNKFPGIQDYVIYNHLYREIENGLIWISSKRFVYYKTLNINDNTMLELKDFIINQFQTIGTEVLSSRKLYAKLSFTNKKLLEELNIKHGQFELFSLIKYKFGKEFYFSRPLISLDPIENKSSYSLIKNHAQKFEQFNLKTITDYTMKMNIGGLYSYLEFMEDLSDSYVQINIDTMIKKDKLQLNENQILELEKMIDLIIDRFEVIDTSTFRAFHVLPNIKMSWNKYLLIGIVRSYLDQSFEITNTNNVYRKTDFIIRRV